MDSVEKKEETNETSTPKTAETKETKPVVPEHDPQASGALIVYQENPIPQQSNALKDAGSWLKDYCTAVKHGRFHPFTKTERKARAATRNQSWGPTGTELAELARLSQHPTDCAIIFAVIDLRLSYPPKKWRNVYKGLTVLDFLLKRGSDDFVARAKHSMPIRLESLSTFAYVAPDGRDVGDNVRHRARAISLLIKDEARLKSEREALAKKQLAGGATAAADDATTSDGQQQPAAINANLPNAGETKGVTLEENKRHVAALKRLLARPDNKLCADCGNPGPGHKPTWASVNLGIFICMRCAGAHRSLGTHISQVRSVSLDTWLASQVEFLAGCGGNVIANSFWEARLPEGGKPAAGSGPDLEAFVRRKYTEKAYALPDGVWPPEEPFEDEEIMEILDSILSEEEKEARAAKKLADAEAADNTDLLGDNAADGEGVVEEEETKEGEGEQGVNDEEEKEEEQAPPPAPLPDLINLMDFDLEDPVPVATTSPTANGDTAAPTQSQELDPLAALENMFAEPKPVADPFALAQAPTNFNQWDMGAVLEVQQKAAVAEPEAAAATPSAVANGGVNGQNMYQQQQQPTPTASTGSTYLPPWAPQPHVSPVPTTGYNTTPESAAAANTFTAGFSAVPHQFTAAPVLPPPPPFTLSGNPFAAEATPPPGSGLGGPANGNGYPYAANGNGMQQGGGGFSFTNGSGMQQQHLQPHEMKAQNVMLGGLDSFVNHAGLVTVKQEFASPQGPAVGKVAGIKPMKPASPSSGSGATPPAPVQTGKSTLNGGTAGFQVQF